MTSATLLTKRFFGTVVASYFLHWGMWFFVVVATQVVMSVLTSILNWLGLLAGRAHWTVEEASISFRWLPRQAMDAAIPILIGLAVGGYVRYKKQNS